MMEWVIENWVLLLVVLVFSIAGIFMLASFLTLPSNKQSEKVKTWLLWAVVEAERALQTGTGRLKLVMVYDQFKTKFPIVANLMPYSVFERLVDEALEEMRFLLSTNESIYKYVFGGDKVDVQDDLRQ